MQRALQAAALTCKGVAHSFGEVQALRDVSLALPSGRITAIVGQNGAGKTTLARVLAGVIRPDSGHVWIGGRESALGAVRQARLQGVEMVHQSFSLPPSFTVAEALEFSSLRSFRTFYRRSWIEQKWAQEVRQAGLDIAVNLRIRDLPIEALQALEITKALAGDARVLILDEPTAVLAPAAATRLFERLRQLRDDGVTVVIVLHKLREVAAVADHVAVLRHGRLVLSPTPLEQTTQLGLTELIIGSVDGAAAEIPSADTEVVPDRDRVPLLALTGVTTTPSATDPALQSVSLVVHSSEIVGVAGVEGNGQRPLVAVITGLKRVVTGSVQLDGRDVTRDPPIRRRQAGLRIVPFDRNTEGVSQSSAIWENIALLSVLRHNSWRNPWLRVKSLKESTATILKQWGVVYNDVQQETGHLSGGNIQRLVLARELQAGLRLLIAAQPTRGLDIGATRFVRDTLRDLRDRGGGTLLISSDLDELFELSDRLIVLSGGSVAGEFVPPFNIGPVGEAMVGVSS